MRSKLKFKRIKLEYKRYGFGGGRRPTISGAQLIIWNVYFLTLLVTKTFCELEF